MEVSNNFWIRNKKIVKGVSFFVLFYTLTPILFFDFFLKSDILFYLFFPSSILWFGMNFNSSKGAFAYYIIYIIIFGVICFFLVKLISVIFKTFKKSKQK